MTRVRFVLVALALLAACGGGAEPATRDLPAPTAADGRPGWLDSLGAPAVAEEGVTIRASDGTTERVWVDKAQRMVYARTCDVARLATQEGAYYGPGNFGPGPGFDFTCP